MMSTKSRYRGPLFQAGLLLLALAALSGCIREEAMKLVYAQRCASCHGPSGQGDGPIAKALSAKIPDFRHTVDNLDVFEIRRIIKEGTGIMPAFRHALEKYQIQDMVRMVRMLSMEERDVEWWEKFEPLVWAHCSVPWQAVYNLDSAAKKDKRS
ncbi:MAG: cytochrome c [Deltaproteobacteria bacterium]|nr:cytochrome c [Deltaproteobacteria bacterium]